MTALGKRKPAHPFSITHLPDAQSGAVIEEPARKLEIPDFNREAEALRKRIAEEALQEARARAYAIERDAYEQGYAAGFKKGQETAEKAVLQQLAPFLDTFQKLTDELARFRSLHLAALEPEIVGLALQIARSVVHEELTINPEAILHITRAAIHAAVERERLVIRLSPADREFLERHRPELLAVEGVKEVVFETDPNLAQGGCIVETRSGEVDASVDTQLAQFEPLGECEA